MSGPEAAFILLAGGIFFLGGLFALMVFAILDGWRGRE